MRTRIAALLVVVLVSVLVPAGKARAEALAVPQAVPATRAPLPLRFEPNTGQTDPGVHYVAHGDGYAAFVTDDGVTLSMRSSAGRTGTLRMSVAGSGSRPRVTAEQMLPGKVNDLRGNDPNAWRRDVPTYAAVRVNGLSEGTETVFYGTEGRLEYDVVVAPGSDPGQLRIRFEGQSATTVAEDGGILLSMKDGDVRHHRPLVYQDGPAGRQLVPVRCVPGAGGEIRFDVGAYDPALPLVVDPVVEFGAFLGGGVDASTPKAVVVDSSGAVYIAGTTETEPFAPDPGLADAFVSKMSADGSSVLYTTYLGGTAGDAAAGLAVDATGAAILVGTTSSMDFPATDGAFDREYSGAEDVFVARLSSDGGAVVFATLIGGADYERAAGVAVDSTGAAYVTGWTESDDFPTTPGAFDTTTLDFQRDAFVVKVSPDGSALVFATVLGGSGNDMGAAIAVDQTGAAYVAGETSSVDFPVTPGAFDTTLGSEDFSEQDVFAARLSPNGSALVYATFLGDSGYQTCTAVAIGPGRVVVVAGATYSADFPTTPGAFDRTFDGTSDAFVTAIAADGRSLVYSTLFGDAGREDATGLAVDAAGAAYLAGNTYSDSSSVASDTLAPMCEPGVGETGAFLARFEPDGSSLSFSTCLGGLASPTVAVDAAAVAHVLGRVTASEYPTTPGAYSRDFHPNAIVLTGISSDGASRVYSTFVDEPSFDLADEVAVDADDDIHIASTEASFKYPTTPGAYDGIVDGFADVVVTKLAADGSLVYSTFLGGADYDGAGGIAVNAAGEVFLTGVTGSEDFPTTPGAYDTALSGGGDAFVVRLAADGGSLVYSTFLGGSFGGDAGHAIVLRPNGAVYVAGITTSLDFPTTPGAPDTAENGSGDAFVVKLNPAGSQLKRSTLFGGLTTEQPFGLAFDKSGVTIVGLRADTSDKGAGDPGDFVVKFNKQLTSIVFSAEYVGRSVRGVASDATGAVYVCGAAFEGFLTTPGAFDSEIGGSFDAFVIKLAPDGSLVYATLLGGEAVDSAEAIAVDATGSVVVVGRTFSSDFPLTAGAPDDHLDGMTDAFVATISPDGAALKFATFLGGARFETATDLALGPTGTVTIVGATSSPDFPPTGFGLRGRSNVFVLKLTGYE